MIFVKNKKKKKKISLEENIQKLLWSGFLLMDTNEKIRKRSVILPRFV